MAAMTEYILEATCHFSEHRVNFLVPWTREREGTPLSTVIEFLVSHKKKGLELDLIGFSKM